LNELLDLPLAVAVPPLQQKLHRAITALSFTNPILAPVLSRCADRSPGSNVVHASGGKNEAIVFSYWRCSRSHLFR
jgi:hypothetical protein